MFGWCRLAGCIKLLKSSNKLATVDCRNCLNSCVNREHGKMRKSLLPGLGASVILWVVGVTQVSGFIPYAPSRVDRCVPFFFSGDKKEPTKNPKNFFEDIRGMLANFDDVVDDFVMKRMGAGEQWYGKRKYNPSGRVDGDYNGMGRSSHYAIEIARVQREVMEERRQRRLEEEATKKNQ